MDDILQDIECLKTLKIPGHCYIFLGDCDNVIVTKALRENVIKTINLFEFDELMKTIFQNNYAHTQSRAHWLQDKLQQIDLDVTKICILGVKSIEEFNMIQSTCESCQPFILQEMGVDDYDAQEMMYTLEGINYKAIPHLRYYNLNGLKDIIQSVFV